jgi:hypothetical protein
MLSTPGDGEDEASDDTDPAKSIPSRGGAASGARGLVFDGPSAVVT